MVVLGGEMLTICDGRRFNFVYGGFSIFNNDRVVFLSNSRVLGFDNRSSIVLGDGRVISLSSDRDCVSRDCVPVSSTDSIIAVTSDIRVDLFSCRELIYLDGDLFIVKDDGRGLPIDN